MTTSPKAPEVSPSSYTDLHALATLIYWLLFQRHPLEGPKHHHAEPGLDEALALGERALFIEHPSDSSNRPKNLRIPFTSLLTPGVQKLMLQAFVEGLHKPRRRPAAAYWERELVRMSDAIVPCSSSKCFLGGYPVIAGQRIRCPMCGSKPPGISTLPILHMYRPRRGRIGHFQRDRDYYFVGWPDRSLHIWHMNPGKMPGPGVDTNPKGLIKYSRGKWYLKNVDFPEVRVLDRFGGHKEVKQGKSLELVGDSQLLLGSPDSCRMAHIQMISI